mmetsp:Transcript_26854/g.82428  ORF Transcript_26854/g.82428 Transcript_26854/m.82428 type:complete len:204 (-) Transcript_26854:272-883(-)
MKSWKSLKAWAGAKRSRVLKVSVSKVVVRPSSQKAERHARLSGAPQSSRLCSRKRAAATSRAASGVATEMTSSRSPSKGATDTRGPRTSRRRRPASFAAATATTAESSTSRSARHSSCRPHADAMASSCSALVISCFFDDGTFSGVSGSSSSDSRFAFLALVVRRKGGRATSRERRAGTSLSRTSARLAETAASRSRNTRDES